MSEEIQAPSVVKDIQGSSINHEVNEEHPDDSLNNETPNFNNSSK